MEPINLDHMDLEGPDEEVVNDLRKDIEEQERIVLK
jgi:hypothetical protein